MYGYNYFNCNPSYAGYNCCNYGPAYGGYDCGNFNQFGYGPQCMPGGFTAGWNAPYAGWNASPFGFSGTPWQYGSPCNGSTPSYFGGYGFGNNDYFANCNMMNSWGGPSCNDWNSNWNPGGWNTPAWSPNAAWNSPWQHAAPWWNNCSPWHASYGPQGNTYDGHPSGFQNYPGNSDFQANYGTGAFKNTSSDQKAA